MLYSYGDMGEKLRILKPANKKVRFSLEELNERLQMGEKEVAVGGFRPLRESLIKLYTRDQENKKPGCRHVWMWSDNLFVLFLGDLR
uniref:Uncharacterized protein n=1 Tax=Helianthus annuus TaxID=4232 RepID=A0A251SX12_HELAN